MSHSPRVTPEQYTALADFRYAIRQFTARSSDRARAEGLPPQQHQALLVIAASSEPRPTVGFLASRLLIASVHGLSPVAALAVLYLLTMVLTELLSNATVAVLVTPVAVALAESLGVSPRPFLVGVMMAASAAFATPFGYQTNVIVYQMAGYRYMDFVRIGLPLNLITFGVAMLAILYFFPF